ncbi:rab guanine nucleotide exchange factor S2 [Collariella sp. IMI 366227]|nr:rab guanine nucleotide exchange factor S2 [Collariella sp. IMI 366227]
MSTIPDPRSRALSPAAGEAMGTPHHPDLDDEVATLSTKLINAINHQTTLDDNLSAAKMELEKSRAKIRQLEAQVEEQREMLAGDVWLATRAADEKRARVDMEQQKKKIEQELENLTTALFEEANKMVISAKEEARLEQEALQRKNDQLRAQLADTESLLRSQQEQLAELKSVMEQMTIEREEQQSPLTVPSSPAIESFAAREAAASPSILRQSMSGPLSPSYPTSFAHLLQPVLRTDLAAYSDFKDLLRTTKRLSASRPVSRPATTVSTSGLASLGLGLGSLSSHVLAGNGSTSSLATAGTPPSPSSQAPNTPTSSISSVSSTAPIPLPQLKETKFYKRALTEDIEPTLRLDTAPGLSWLARRSVLSAMTDGSLVVEPTPSTATGRFGRVTKLELYPCSLCGESGTEKEHLRTHRFRISEADTTQIGYPLCRYCLARVRSTCEFLGFLRIVKDGHWRADDEDAEKAAWEESVRLREQMFWSRIGGGVVPSGQHARHLSSSSAALSFRGEKSPRPSHEGTPRPLEQAKFLELPTAEQLAADGVIKNIDDRALSETRPSSSGSESFYEPQSDFESLSERGDEQKQAPFTPLAAPAALAV